MNDEAAGPTGFTHLQRLQIWLIAAIGWMGVWLIDSTLRYTAENEEALEQFRRIRQPVIFCFWHNQIFLETHYFRFQDIVVITSQHFDGEYIAKIIHRFGYGTARGSSSRGGLRAVLSLKRHLEEGRDVAFTIDGPRGPVYRVKPGPIWLARKTGAPIVTLHIEPQRFWSLKSWDSFRIPKPFSRALLKFGQPFRVTDEQSDEQWVECLQAELDRLRMECGRWRQMATGGMV